MKIYDFLLFLCYCMNKQLAKQQLWPSRGVVEGELAPAPASCGAPARCISKVICEAKRGYLLGAVAQICSEACGVKNFWLRFTVC